MIKFQIDTSKLTVGDMLLAEDAQEGKRPIHSMVSMMAKFMVDEQDQPIPLETAVETLAQVSIDDFANIASEFGGAIRRNAVPLTIKGG